MCFLCATVCAGLQTFSRTGVNVQVSTALIWKAAGQAYMLSRTDFRGLNLREKVFVMQQINLFVAKVSDGGENDGDSTLRAPLLGQRQ
jgi:hypothetical protein